ncbi:hypothetical protein RJ46_19265 [Vibrio sinaloensis]|nr:hypothetical protein RJ46_19265 [Vibrio sinaloensis]
MKNKPGSIKSSPPLNIKQHQDEKIEYHLFTTTHILEVAGLMIEVLERLTIKQKSFPLYPCFLWVVPIYFGS